MRWCPSNPRRVRSGVAISAKGRFVIILWEWLDGYVADERELPALEDRPRKPADWHAQVAENVDAEHHQSERNNQHERHPNQPTWHAGVQMNVTCGNNNRQANQAGKSKPNQALQRVQKPMHVPWTQVADQ